MSNLQKKCCVINVCGNGTVESAVEECDDGNNDNRDGCSSSCQIEPNYVCSGTPSSCLKQCTYTVKCYDVYGDGWNNGTAGFNEVDIWVSGLKIKDGFAVFDSYGPANYDFTVTLGDTILIDYEDYGSYNEEETYELWQDSTLIQGRGRNYGENLTGGLLDINYTAVCQLCGNGIVESAFEDCDDGNTADDGNGCSETCIANNVCGNGTIESAVENCDDGNIIDDGNGCSETCTANNVCGNGTIESVVENCDDGNTITEECAYGETNCIVCTNTCHNEAGVISYCGDGATDVLNNEDCDDGNQIDDGNGCSETCEANNICGDGTVDSAVEECDNGINTDVYTTVVTTECASGCVIPGFCGNGIIDADQVTYTEDIVLLHLDEGTGTLLADASGNGHDSATGDAAWISDGRYDTALSFDGTDDLILWSYSAKPANNFTMSAWVKVTDTHEIDAEETAGTGGLSGQKYLFAPNHEVDNAGAGISVGTNGISVYEHGSGYLPAVAVYTGSISSTWNHVAVTYTDKQAKIYLNGLLVKTGLTSPRANVYAPTTAGGGAYGYFNGEIDEIHIVDRTLTAIEIADTFHEECDDGNIENDDGCDSECRIE